MLIHNARTGAVLLREEHVYALNSADLQGSDCIECKDLAANPTRYKTEVSVDPEVNSPAIIR